MKNILVLGNATELTLGLIEGRNTEWTSKGTIKPSWNHRPPR